MKSVILVRHAKSNWENPLQQDFDRPLNERGKRDAPVMGARLKNKVSKVDLFISSPANRAISTAAYFSVAFGVSPADILQKPELYHARPHTFYDVISGVNDNADTIVLFSHNGGITDFVNSLTSTKIDSMPTCSVFAVTANINTWSEFFDAPKSFSFFDRPKDL